MAQTRTTTMTVRNFCSERTSAIFVCVFFTVGWTSGALANVKIRGWDNIGHKGGLTPRTYTTFSSPGLGHYSCVFLGGDGTQGHTSCVSSCQLLRAHCTNMGPCLHRGLFTTVRLVRHWRLIQICVSPQQPFPDWRMNMAIRMVTLTPMAESRVPDMMVPRSRKQIRQVRC